MLEDDAVDDGNVHDGKCDDEAGDDGPKEEAIAPDGREHGQVLLDKGAFVFNIGR